jgi:hypothetical protein
VIVRWLQQLPTSGMTGRHGFYAIGDVQNLRFAQGILAREYPQPFHPCARTVARSARRPGQRPVKRLISLLIHPPIASAQHAPVFRISSRWYTNSQSWRPCNGARRQRSHFAPNSTTGSAPCPAPTSSVTRRVYGIVLAAVMSEAFTKGSWWNGIAHLASHLAKLFELWGCTRAQHQYH